MSSMPRSKEQWKAVRGYEGRYEVSDHGRVRSLNYRRTGRVQELRANPDTDGYPQLPLCENGTPQTVRVHTLVLEAFAGPRPQGLVCDHIDSNPKNNRTGNLRWITNQENTIRGRSPELSKMRLRIWVGSKHPNAKLTEKQVIKIRRRYAAGGISHRELGRIYGMTKASIGYIIRRRNWKHI